MHVVVAVLVGVVHVVVAVLVGVVISAGRVPHVLVGNQRSCHSPGWTTCNMEILYAGVNLLLLRGGAGNIS